jgi:hypothetical protein
MPAGNEASLIWLLPLVAERLRGLVIRPGHIRLRG